MGKTKENDSNIAQSCREGADRHPAMVQPAGGRGLTRIKRSAPGADGQSISSGASAPRIAETNPRHQSGRRS